MSLLPDTLRNVLYVLRKGSSFGRFRLLRTYVRLKLGNLGSDRGAGEDRIFGQRIHFSDAGNFVVLFEEIFIPEPYCVSLPPRPRIIDCGANIGMSMAYFYARHQEAQITAFEPDKNNFQFLAENCKLNGWAADVHEQALDSMAGEKKWYTFGTGTLVAGFRTELSAGPPTATYLVHTARLSSYIVERIDLLKLDVEGAEHPIIQDLVETGKIAWVDRIVMEYHHHITTDEDQLGQLLSALENAGFGYDFSGLKHSGCEAGRVHNFMIYAYKKQAG